MKITWSPLAIQRVLEASEFISRDKPDAAARWAESTFRAVERLVDFPESGRVVPELGRPELREIIHGAYRIIYRIGDTEVYILTVRRASQVLEETEVE